MIETIRVTVLLEHHGRDEGWTAHVPLIEHCLAEGPTPEQATRAILPEIEYFVKHQPDLIEILREQPTFTLREVTFHVDESRQDGEGSC